MCAVNMYSMFLVGHEKSVCVRPFVVLNNTFCCSKKLLAERFYPLFSLHHYSQLFSVYLISFSLPEWLFMELLVLEPFDLYFIEWVKASDKFGRWRPSTGTLAPKRMAKVTSRALLYWKHSENKSGLGWASSKKLNTRLIILILTSLKCEPKNKIL